LAHVEIPDSVKQLIGSAVSHRIIQLFGELNNSAIGPRLARGGAFFSHNVRFVKVLQVLTDRRLWIERLCEPVPIVFDAGCGLGDTFRTLGFLLKTQRSTIATSSA